MRNMIVATAVAAACFTSVHTYAADETTTVGGLAYIDFTNLKTTTTTKATGVTADGATNGTGADVSRFYLVVTHVFDDTWSANLTTDFQYSSAISSTEIYIKKAYVQAKINDAFIVRAGSAELPWIGFVEGLYGYRYVAKTLTDIQGTANAADWGIHALGSAGNGVFNYAVSAVNGANYKNTTRSKTLDFEGRISIVPIKGLTFAVGMYTGKRGQETALNPAENTFTRTSLLAAYVANNFRVGAEYYQVKNFKDVQQDGAANANGTIPSAAIIDTDKGSAYSAWASYNFTKQVSVFARYDDQKANPNDTTASSRENTTKYMHVGVGYQPRKNIDLAFVYKNTKTDTNFGPTSGKIDEIGVWSQVKF